MLYVITRSVRECGGKAGLLMAPAPTGISNNARTRVRFISSQHCLAGSERPRILECASKLTVVRTFPPTPKAPARLAEAPFGREGGRSACLAGLEACTTFDVNFETHS